MAAPLDMPRQDSWVNKIHLNPVVSPHCPREMVKCERSVTSHKYIVELGIGGVLPFEWGLQYGDSCL